MHQVSLLGILLASQPGLALGALIQGVLEASFGEFRPELRRLRPYAGAQSCPVVVYRPPGLVVSMSPVQPLTFRLG